MLSHTLLYPLIIFNDEIARRHRMHARPRVANKCVDEPILHGNGLLDHSRNSFAGKPLLSLDDLRFALIVAHG